MFGRVLVCASSKSAFDDIVGRLPVGQESRKVPLWSVLKRRLLLWIYSSFDLVRTGLLDALCLNLVIEFTAPTLTFGFWIHIMWLPFRLLDS